MEHSENKELLPVRDELILKIRGRNEFTRGAFNIMDKVQSTEMPEQINNFAESISPALLSNACNIPWFDTSKRSTEELAQIAQYDTISGDSNEIIEILNKKGFFKLRIQGELLPATLHHSNENSAWMIRVTRGGTEFSIEWNHELLNQKQATLVTDEFQHKILQALNQVHLDERDETRTRYSMRPVTSEELRAMNERESALTILSIFDIIDQDCTDRPEHYLSIVSNLMGYVDGRWVGFQPSVQLRTTRIDPQIVPLIHKLPLLPYQNNGPYKYDFQHGLYFKQPDTALRVVSRWSDILKKHHHGKNPQHESHWSYKQLMQNVGSTNLQNIRFIKFQRLQNYAVDITLRVKVPEENII